VTPARAGTSQRAESRDHRTRTGTPTRVDVDHLGEAIPVPVQAILRRLWDAGFDAFVVGGSVRDLILGRDVADWDVATSALPEQTAGLFSGAIYENRFGTVAVRREGATDQVTTFRREHDYADHRRPERVEFGTDVDEDLARRDFTVNAIAWGGRRDAAGLRDPFGGLDDLRAGIIRAVGRADDRFGEDALRVVRALRFAATLGFAIEPATLDAIARNATLTATLSGERVGAELRRILEAPRPSVAFRLMDQTGVLDVLFPELALQRAVPQNKVPGADLWEHTLAAVDAADPGRPAVRLAALLHDVGKPATLAEGHFPHHDREGAAIAEAMLRRLAFPRQDADRVVHLVGQHMFTYTRTWGDAAVRRFMRRVRVEAIDDLLALREADNAGSGLSREAGHLPELRRRVADEIASGHALELGDLAVDGNDLRQALELPEGPEVGRILRALLDRVVADPANNDRARLLELAQRLHAGAAQRSRA
jgi:tRNA nucleotidyltransferase/poly(A) polymerase